MVGTAGGPARPRSGHPLDRCSRGGVEGEGLEGFLLAPPTGRSHRVAEGDPAGEYPLPLGGVRAAGLDLEVSARLSPVSEMVTPPIDWKQLPQLEPGLPSDLISWFDEHGRNFPWRETRDPYHLLCVEVMLQRTRAKIVKKYFEEFSRRFRRPEDFVSAGREESDKIFDAIGLRWRAKYFWEMHVQLVKKFQGEVPRSFDTLRSLPGVGQYAASAVCVFAYEESRTVLDSNVLRILGRYFGIRFPDHARRSARVRRWASRFAPADPGRCRKWNWALIDFGSLVCTPSSPECSGCPVSASCWYAGSRGNLAD